MKLPRQVSEIPILNESGINLEGTIQCIPVVGTNIIKIFQFAKPWNLQDRFYAGKINLEHVKI